MIRVHGAILALAIRVIHPRRAVQALAIRMIHPEKPCDPRSPLQLRGARPKCHYSCVFRADSPYSCTTQGQSATTVGIFWRTAPTVATPDQGLPIQLSLQSRRRNTVGILRLPNGRNRPDPLAAPSGHRSREIGQAYGGCKKKLRWRSQQEGLRRSSETLAEKHQQTPASGCAEALGWTERNERWEAMVKKLRG